MKRFVAAAAVVFALAGASRATGFMVPGDPRLRCLQLESHRVNVRIEDQGAVTTVVEVFKNQHKRELEATFVFPLPKGAAVSDFKMYVNGNLVTGEVVEAGEARRTYQAIVRQMRDPGLLEYMNSNLLKLSVYPVPPNGSQEVRIEYTQALQATGGLVEYTYPLKTPQYAARTMKDFTLNVDIEARAGIKNVYSPTHEISIRRIDDHHVVAGFERSASRLDRDFQLFYSLSDTDFGASVISYRPKGEDGYFLLLLSPKVAVKKEDIVPKDVAFVIDVSGSMKGEKIEQAKKALDFCIESLSDEDRFAIITFSNTVETMSKRLVEATAENRRKGRQFVDAQRAAGGTDIHSALMEALSRKTTDQRPYLIVFLTDGLPTVGQCDVGRILDDVLDNNKASTRIFSFGVGYDVNTKLLDSLTSLTRACNQYVHPGEDIEVKVSAFFERIGDPLLSQVEVGLDHAGAYDIYPTRPPDFFRGTQIVLAGRYRQPGTATVTLTGEGRSGKLEFRYECDFTADREAASFVSNIWANRKIAFLLSEIRMHGGKTELKSAVIRLAKEYGIVTPYTSYLVTDRTRPAPIPLDQSGWGGTRRGGRRPVAEQEHYSRLLERYERKDAEMTRRRNERSTARQGQIAATSTATDEKVPLEKLISAVAQEQGMAEVSGKQAVAASEALALARKTDRVARSRLVRKASDRNFINIDGVWIDEDATNDLEVVKCKFASDAYFKILESAPELKEALMLGERVIIVAGKYCLIIDDEGRENADDETIKAVIKALSAK
ncbi:MAG: VWA domain-containing protein [Planctomycetes bacterium]|nr:VWA domain-containing protein [Planctomycetota bacterium]